MNKGVFVGFLFEMLEAPSVEGQAVYAALYGLFHNGRLWGNVVVLGPGEGISEL